MADKLYDLLVSIGIDPIYFSAIVALLISFTYFKHWHDWENLPGYQMRWIITVFIGTAFLVFSSLIKFACNHM